MTAEELDQKITALQQTVAATRRSLPYAERDYNAEAARLRQLEVELADLKHQRDHAFA